MIERAGNFAGPFPFYYEYVVIKYPLNKTHETIVLCSFALSFPVMPLLW